MPAFGRNPDHLLKLLIQMFLTHTERIAQVSNGERVVKLHQMLNCALNRVQAIQILAEPVPAESAPVAESVLPSWADAATARAILR